MVRNHLEVENKLHEHIRILKIQLKEKDDTISKLRKELRLPNKTKWIEKDD
jgi:hypothetical protein